MIRAALLGTAAALAFLAVPAAAQEADNRCAPSDTSAPAEWQGVWLPEGLDTDISGRFLSRGSKFVGFDAPWNEAGWERVRANLALFGTGEYRVIGFGFPAMLDTAGELSFYVGHNQTVILNVYRDVQIIHTDGREHIPADEAFPSTWGSSVGCWEGDTLTIDTRYMQFDPTFSPGHAPLSDQAHFVWTLQLAEPEKIAMRMLITDPVYLDAPWVVENTMLRYYSAESLLLDGSNNDRTVFEDGSHTISADGSNRTGLPDMPAPAQLSASEMALLAGRYVDEKSGAAFTFEAREGRLWVTMPLLAERSTTTPVFPQSARQAVGLIGHAFDFVTAADGTVTAVEITRPDGTSMTAARAAP